jgi:branched-chain amino acid transport system substrate-binding protein
MRSDPRVLVGVLLVLTAMIAACGDQAEPLRIGVITDCTGIYRSLEDAELSGASLPLIQRGAKLHARRSSDGIGTAEVAGRPVQLVRGCTESLEFSVLTGEVRRLAEDEHVDVIVAATTGPDEVVLRDVAKRYPRVLFVPVVHGPREVMLHRAAPNVYRFAADDGQGVAGLAEYAYRRLGWRRAAIIAAPWDGGWSERDAFTAEFCALGGRVTSQVSPVFLFDDKGGEAARVPRAVDGVAVLGASSFFQPNGLIHRLARRVGDPARHIVVGPDTVDEFDTLRANADALRGVVAGSYLDPASRHEYLRAFAEAFPGVPEPVADGSLVRGFRDGVEVVLRGFERSGGDTQQLPAALAHLDTDLLGGPVRLDRTRQGVVTSRVVRISQSGEPTLTPVRSVPDVDQSIGGLIAPSASPSDRPAPCRRGHAPPPWAQ